MTAYEIKNDRRPKLPFGEVKIDNYLTKFFTQSDKSEHIRK